MSTEFKYPSSDKPELKTINVSFSITAPACDFVDDITSEEIEDFIRYKVLKNKGILDKYSCEYFDADGNLMFKIYTDNFLDEHDYEIERDNVTDKWSSNKIRDFLERYNCEFPDFHLFKYEQCCYNDGYGQCSTMVAIGNKSDEPLENSPSRVHIGFPENSPNLVHVEFPVNQDKVYCRNCNQFQP